YLEEVRAVQRSDPSWFTSAWLYVECYMYRRIQQALEESTRLRTFDPFRAQKAAGLLNSESPIASLASYVHEATQDPSTLTPQDIHTLFNQLIQVNLWGNKCDLSISGGSENYQKHDPIQQLASLKPFIIINQTDQVWSRISQPNSSKRVDLVVDNAGFELFSDLVLAELLLVTKLADVIHFHLKAMPWFVSDATREDFMWTLDVLRASNHADVSHYGNRWRRRIEDGTWVLHEHDFWTCPHDYSQMEAVAPDLYADLAKSHLVVFKGDLNYRKITGDLKWPHTVPFSRALRGFLPSALCTLRTLKADLIVGLEEGQAERIEREAEEAADWMKFKGRWEYRSERQRELNKLEVAFQFSGDTRGHCAHTSSVSAAVFSCWLPRLFVYGQVSHGTRENHLTDMSADICCDIPNASETQSSQKTAMGSKFEKSPFRWKVATLVLFLVCVALAVTLIVVLCSGVSTGQHDGHGQPCAAGYVVEPVDPTRPGPFSDLSLEEIDSVRNYMLAQDSLQLTPWEHAEISDNYIYAIETHLPAKDDVLRFLDGGGPAPERLAKVTVYAGQRTPAVVEEYIVGPVTNPSRHTVYTLRGRKFPIPFHSRVPDSKENNLVEGRLREVSETAYRVLKESFDTWYHNCTDRCLTFIDTAPRGFRSGQRKTWWYAMRNLQGMTLNPVGFMVEVNTEGANTSQWRAERVFYNGQLFDSVHELVSDYNQGTVEKVTLPMPKDDNTLFSSFRRRGPPQPPTPLRAPEQFEPDGRRYKVRGRHVEYMGWSFDWRLSTTHGPQLLDIKMNGERVVYELSLQEIGAFYSGHDPLMLSTFFLDTGWNMGSSHFELVPGVDCPTTASYLDVLHQKDSARPRQYKNAVCVFELNTGIPLRRHYESDFQGGYLFYGGMVDNVLVVRTISTVFNYDYVLDFIFHQNGVLEVRTSLTGYVMSTFYTQAEAPYGYKMWQSAIGNAHHHVINLKVDMDVGGIENRYETVDFVQTNITNPLYPELYHIHTKAQRNPKTTEREAILHYNFDRPKYYNFYNQEKSNSYGIKKGYRIQINAPTKELVPRGWGPMRGAAWADYQMAVTRRKESEPASSSLYNQNDPFDPVVDFDRFLDDDENIVDQDLVAWVTMGTHHVPHAEDAPVTATAGNQLSLFLRPFHFFDEDPSMASSNGVLITYDKDSHEVDVDRFGTPYGSNCLPREAVFAYNGTWPETED
ncbi:amine oxidase, partial [Branchiostoma belcheri]